MTNLFPLAGIEQALLQAFAASTPSPIPTPMRAEDTAPKGPQFTEVFFEVAEPEAPPVMPVLTVKKKEEAGGQPIPELALPIPVLPVQAAPVETPREPTTLAPAPAPAAAPATVALPIAPGRRDHLAFAIRLSPVAPQENAAPAPALPALSSTLAAPAPAPEPIAPPAAFVAPTPAPAPNTGTPALAVPVLTRATGEPAPVVAAPAPLPTPAAPAPASLERDLAAPAAITAPEHDAPIPVPAAPATAPVKPVAPEPTLAVPLPAPVKPVPIPASHVPAAPLQTVEAEPAPELPKAPIETKPRATKPARPITAAPRDIAPKTPNPEPIQARPMQAKTSEPQPSTHVQKPAHAESETDAPTPMPEIKPQAAAPVPSDPPPAALEPARDAKPVERAPRTYEVHEPAPVKPPEVARDIRLELHANDRKVELRVLERGGEVQVAVRTPDARLAGDLRDNLPALSSRLEQTGFRTESLHAATASSSETLRPIESPVQAEHRSADHHSKQDPRDRREDAPPQQQNPRKQKGKEFEWLMSSLR